MTLLLSTILACADPATVPDSGLSLTDTALTAPTPDGVIATVSPHVGTVVRVSWTVQGPGTSRVVWDGGTSAALDNAPGAAEVLLVGLAPDTVVEGVVRSEHGGDTADSDPFSVTTGSLHPDLPQLVIDLHTDDAGSGWVMGSTKTGSPAALILDRAGRIVWWHVGDALYDDLAATDQGLVYLGAGAGGRTLHHVDWWGETVASVALPDAHHAFGLRADGTAAFIATDKRPWETYESVAGDAVRLLDADGGITDLWNVWDHVDPVPAPGWDSPYYDDAEDWTHANGLDVDPSDDTALLTLTGLDTLALLDLETGQVLEGSPAVGGTWAFAPGDAPDFPHGVHRLGPTSLLMTTSGDGETLAAEYSQVDGLWERTWAYGPAEPVSPNAGGAATRLPGGNTLVAWGRDGFAEEVTPAGDVAWRASFLRGPALGTFSAVDLGPWGTTEP